MARTVELDRLDRTGVDHPAVPAVRGDVDQAGPARTHHPSKFAYGVIGMGVAFLLFLPMAGTTGRTVPALFVAAIMAVFAISELMLSPIGLSVTTQLAPTYFERR